jgi:hypothetical protein
MHCGNEVGHRRLWQLGGMVKLLMFSLGRKEVTENLDRVDDSRCRPSLVIHQAVRQPVSSEQILIGGIHVCGRKCVASY